MKLHGHRMNDHLTRYRLPNGWFMDRDYPRFNMGSRYAIYEPGAGPGGCADWRGSGNTQLEALTRAGIDPGTGYLSRD